MLNLHDITSSCDLIRVLSSLCSYLFEIYLMYGFKNIDCEDMYTIDFTVFYTNGVGHFLK